jgi:glycosyltransferase involved in cell wall biosynthesis
MNDLPGINLRRTSNLMKILHLTKKYPDALGGDAVVVANLEDRQVKMGMEVFILTHNCPDVADRKNIRKFGLRLPSHQLDRITVRRLLALLILPVSGYRYLKEVHPDIIHSHSPELGFMLSLPARVLGIPVVNTCHGVPFMDRNTALLKRYADIFFLKYSGFARIITVDRHSLDQFQQQGIFNAEYIPNGVDPAFWRREPEAVLKKNPEITFLFVGRLEEQKGLRYLIGAAGQLHADGREFSIQLVGDGSQRPLLEKLVDAIGLGSTVRFSGRLGLDELREAYTHADIFVLPSVWEGMPLTLLEAWASGLPVIITNVGNIPEICVDRENAWMIEPGNESDLHDAMLALSESEELRNRLGRNGMMAVLENYSWSSVAQKTVDLYKKVCGRSP